MELKEEQKMRETNNLSPKSVDIMDDDNTFDVPMCIHDDIHGYFEISDRIKCLIDTKEFQRLRFLKQLGATYYTFPGATHNRFEHSIGVMYIAGQVLNHLSKKQPTLGITEYEHYCVRAAGLLHGIVILLCDDKMCVIIVI